MTTGHCPHGEFDIIDGCPQCMADRMAEEGNTKEGIAEAIKAAQDVLAGDTSAVERLHKAVNLPSCIVKVQYYSETTGFESIREDTYYSVETLKVGDIVMVPVRDTTGKAKVSAIDVPESEIADYKDKVKTIPAGSIIAPKVLETTIVEEGLDRMVNLCDTCTLRMAYPTCLPDGVEYGEGFGNDNIIKCSNYENESTLEPAPISEGIIPSHGLDELEEGLNSEGLTLTKETAIALRPGEDIEARGWFDEGMTALQYAKDRVIKTLEENVAASDDLSTISKLKKAMDGKKREYLEPLLLQTNAFIFTSPYSLGMAHYRSGPLQSFSCLCYCELCSRAERYLLS